MSNKIPNGLTRHHIIAAIYDIDEGISHSFGESTGYDVLFEGSRYAPKAVIGLAAGKLTGAELGPYDFRGGLGSKCFRILEACDFTIVSKGDTNPFPDEINDETTTHIEGALQTVTVNRYERDSKARTKSIQHHGLQCQVCDLDFKAVYGALGDGFIHVHHTIPLAQIGESYAVDPCKDLKPVCPNCHAMLHKRIPPYTINELQEVMEAARSSFQKKETG